ncbi:MAG TPA: substrate-binding domain-containing protein [Streptosporangiaceae bacterium]
MTAPRSPRSKASRRRRRRVRTKSLVFLAVSGCFLLLLGLSSAQIVGRYSCESNPVVIKVAVSPDIAPAIQQVVNVFNTQGHQAAGRCVQVQLAAEPPTMAAAQIDGTRNVAGSPPDAWIPDSSLWVDEARLNPVGATKVQPAGFSVARSPLLIVMPDKASAAKVPSFGKVGWRLLLPSTAGGPVVPANVQMDLPDPAQSAAGLASLIEISRLLGPNHTVKFTRFAYHSAVTSYFDTPGELTSFVSLAAAPLNGLPITVTSEQAVLAYDEANPSRPLAASYPTAGSANLGSPELDYPYVLTTSNSARYAAAKLFGDMLTMSYARSVIRYAGFRVGQGAGVPDTFPAAFGLGSQLLQVAPPASATEVPTALQAWNRLSLGSRDLALIDVSSVMGSPADPANPTGPTLEQELTATASRGLALFADSASLGLWEFADHMHGELPYRQLVPLGPLTASSGVITRRTQLQNLTGELKPTAGPQVALYGTMLDAYKYMVAHWKPKFFNTVVVLASGLENAPGDITAPALVSQLSKLYSKARPVSLIIIAFDPANFATLQKVASAGGGQAYLVTSPSQIGAVFFHALAHRLCDPKCVAA